MIRRLIEGRRVSGIMHVVLLAGVMTAANAGTCRLER